MMLCRKLLVICLLLVLGGVSQTSRLSAAAVTNTIPTNIDASLAHFVESYEATAVSVIVQKNKTAVSVEEAVQSWGGELGSSLPIINGFAALLPTTAVYQLAQHPGVKYLSLDATVNTSAQTVSNNLLTNPGFEDGLVGWDVWGEAGLPVADAHSGSQAFRVGAVEGGGGQVITAVAGQTYTLNGWFRVSNGPVWAGFGLDFLDSNQNEISEILRTVNSSSYQQFSLAEVAPVGTAYVRFWMWKSGSNGFLYADDLNVSALLPLDNPGFESGMSGWHSDGVVSLNSSSHSGSNAVRIGTDTGGVSSNTLINVVPNETLKFTGWFRIKDNPEWAGFGIDFLDSNQE